jgi:hypothetical protein
MLKRDNVTLDFASEVKQNALLIILWGSKPRLLA